MAVYVDDLRDWGWRLGPSCHLIADNLFELHSFAEKVGMDRARFQISNSGIPHYDLTREKRRLAVKLGAIELSNREFVTKMRKLKMPRF